MQLFFALGLGVLAIAAGLASGIFAVLTRRRRQAIAATYARTGGAAYTVVQVGCAVTLVLGGLLLIGVVVFGRILFPR